MGYAVSDDVRALIAELLHKGRTAAAIAKELGVSNFTVYRVRRELATR